MKIFLFIISSFLFLLNSVNAEIFSEALKKAYNKGEYTFEDQNIQMIGTHVGKDKSDHMNYATMLSE